VGQVTGKEWKFRTNSTDAQGDAPEPEPSNIAAERVVLGYLLVGGVWCEDIAAHDFANEQEQLIWSAMRAIHTAGDVIDLQRLAAELAEKNGIEFGYLEKLGQGCEPGMRIEPYITKLHEATAKRDIRHHMRILNGHIRMGDLIPAAISSHLLTTSSLLISR
jgi:hypothetical protein